MELNVDLKAELDLARKKREMLVAKANELETQRSQILTEGIKLDGEIRLLERLIKANVPPTTSKKEGE